MLYYLYCLYCKDPKNCTLFELFNIFRKKTKNYVLIKFFILTVKKVWPVFICLLAANCFQGEITVGFQSTTATSTNMRVNVQNTTPEHFDINVNGRVIGRVQSGEDSGYIGTYKNLEIPFFFSLRRDITGNNGENIPIPLTTIFSTDNLDSPYVKLIIESITLTPEGRVEVEYSAAGYHFAK